METALVLIVELLEDPDTKPTDIIRIFDKLAKYGLGEKHERVVLTTKLLNELADVVIRFVPSEADREQIKQAWLDILADHIGA